MSLERSKSWCVESSREFRALSRVAGTGVPWLTARVLDAGCELVTGHIEGRLAEGAPWLRREYGADVIVNCAGLGAARLADDHTMFPLRGALLHVMNDGVYAPRVTSAHALAYDEAEGRRNMVFVVPRGEDKLVLGGTLSWGCAREVADIAAELA